MFQEVGVAPRNVFFAQGIEGRQRLIAMGETAMMREALLKVMPMARLIAMAEVFDESTEAVISEECDAYAATLVALQTRIIENVDVLIVDLTDSQHQYLGVFMEIVYAVNAHIPVVAITQAADLRERAWLRAHVDVFAANYLEAAQAATALSSKDWPVGKPGSGSNSLRDILHGRQH